jgi:hypothetical protein
MPNIRETYCHQQLQNSLTPEQIRIIDEELARIREARRIALEHGGDPQNVDAGNSETRVPSVQAGCSHNTGIGAVDQQDPTTGLGDLQDTTTEAMDTQNPTNKPAAEEIISNNNNRVHMPKD